MIKSMPASAGGKLERMALNASRSAMSVATKMASEPRVRAHCWSHSGGGGRRWAMVWCASRSCLSCRVGQLKPHPAQRSPSPAQARPTMSDPLALSSAAASTHSQMAPTTGSIDDARVDRGLDRTWTFF